MEEKEKRRGLNTTMSMMELVIAVGLFAIISVFLVEFFMKAVTLQNKANELTEASIMCESCIEALKSESLDEFTGADARYVKQADGSFTKTFTKKWEPAGSEADSSGEAYYTFSLTEENDVTSGIVKYTATVTDKSGNEIYSLTGTTYGGGNE